MRGPTVVLPRQAHPPAALMRVSAMTLVVLAALALAYVVYALWPRWSEAPAEPTAPELPIVVSDVLFRIPPAAIRQDVQRRAGTQERVDLAFLWPSLEPSAPTYGANADPAVSAAPRLFVSIAANPTGMTPVERLKTIYPRYLEASTAAGPPGLTTVPFRADTPYRGEELFYDTEVPDRFITRCTRDAGPAQGNCLYERFIGSDVITVRFSRAWLADWRAVLNRIDVVIDRLQPAQH
ncbi:MAG: hypothetical protein ACXWJW_00660 [Xanthobacteraceae bacterium]